MTPQQELYQALSNDTAILNVVSDDKSNITNSYPDKNMFKGENVESNFPRITFVLDDRRPVFYVDNQAVYDELQFQVDIWLPTSLLDKHTLNTIKLEIDRVMRDLGYFKDSEGEERQVYNRVSNLSLAYSKKFQSNL